MTWLRRHGFTLLLGMVPLALLLDWLTPDWPLAIFLISVLAIVPLAGYIGHATSRLAARLGGGIGGLLNATFGNVSELIIGVFALHAGLPGLVKASITGSIMANVLLVFGAAAFSGGLRTKMLRFNRSAASLGTTMLLLSAVGLVVPAVFHVLARQTRDAPELQLDTDIAIILLVTYCAGLVFTLKTHRQLYQAGAAEPAGGARRAGLAGPLMQLVAATAGTAVISELLVGTVSDAAEQAGMSQLFVGVVILAIVGNAAEHYSAVRMAREDQMDAALAIAVGSSQQIALFVAPVLLLMSYVVGPHPMDLLFTVFEVVAVGIAVVCITFIAHDGETHWMEGVQLLAVYAILAIGFYFLPAP
jgi:Ca2+:H+ antiporter